MRLLKRNARAFQVKNQASVTEATSGSYYTGERTITYGDAVDCKGNISEASGKVTDNPFGQFTNYNKVIQLETLPSGFNEQSIVLIGNEQYSVVRIAEYMDHYSVAIAKEI